ncbi:MAG: hypothetical protein N4Q32_01375 [Neisseriaceae bacterium]|nr:hypothetical protein [Neisseriaceae bacterium]
MLIVACFIHISFVLPYYIKMSEKDYGVDEMIDDPYLTKSIDYLCHNDGVYRRIKKQNCENLSFVLNQWRRDYGTTGGSTFIMLP